MRVMEGLLLESLIFYRVTSDPMHFELPFASSATMKKRFSVRLVPLALIAILTFSLSGCALWPFGNDEGEDVEDTESSEAVLYRHAQRFLRSGNYTTAIKHLEHLEARFPFGRYAEQAQLELIYARHMSLDHDAARNAADRFIRLHPNHPNVDYAYYLKGLASYNKNSNLFDRFVATDPAKRDMTSVREAYAEFAQLLARYPTSQYVPDARQRMIYLRELIARSELHIADYYLRRGAYMAANNRARYVLENYGQTGAVPDALAIMTECAYNLGLEDAANESLRVLASNYPSYPAFNDEGELVLAEQVRNRDRSWTNLVTLGLLDRPEVPPPLKLKTPTGAAPELAPSVVAGQNQAPSTRQPDSGSKEKKKGWFSWLPFVE